MNDCSFNRAVMGSLTRAECDDGNREDADGCRNSCENAVVVMGLRIDLNQGSKVTSV